MSEFLKSALKQSCTFIYRYIFTILCVILFSYISFKFEHFMYHKKVAILSSISLIFIMHIFSRLRYNITFTILFSLIVTINFYSAFILNSHFNVGLLGSIMDTHSAEAMSMAKSILKIGIPMYILVFFLVFMSMRELKRGAIPIKTSIIGAIISIFIIIPYNAKDIIHSRYGGMNDEVSEYPLVIVELAVQHAAPIFYGNIFTVANYIDERIRYRNFFTPKSKILAEGISNSGEENNLLPQKIYLILGESATRNRLSLYGYRNKTTPYLDSLSLADKNFKVYEGYSSGTITRDAYRFILTSSSPHNMDAFLTTQSLIDMANNKGIKSVWISPILGALRQKSGTYLQLLSSSAQELEFSTKNDDLKSIEILQSIENNNDKTQLIIIALNGSHGAYAERYDEIDEIALPYDSTLSELSNSYNKTIHHTDRFIKGMHEIMLKDSSSVMIYLSDHGEIIGKGHGIKDGRAQIEIPMVTFNNSRTNIDSIIDKYTFESDKKEMKGLNNSAIFYIIAELMGYTVSEDAVNHALKESLYIYYPDRTIGLLYEMKDGENKNEE